MTCSCGLHCALFSRRQVPISCISLLFFLFFISIFYEGFESRVNDRSASWRIDYRRSHDQRQCGDERIFVKWKSYKVSNRTYIIYLNNIVNVWLYWSDSQRVTHHNLESNHKWLFIESLDCFRLTRISNLRSCTHVQEDSLFCVL